MNILFLLKSFEIGGLEVVTSVLANKFKEEGHCVVLWSFYEGATSLKDRLDTDIPIIYGNGINSLRNNIDSIKNTIISYQINVVINQWGLPFLPAYSLSKAQKGLNVKVISVYHNDPLQNGRVQRVTTEIANTENIVKKTILQFKKMVYRCVTGFSMRYVYLHSDVYEVLSPSFVSHFKQFTWMKDTSKVVVQTNPITINIKGFNYDSNTKSKEIIYVGRVDFTQKRVHRVIETWGQLEFDFPERQLTIVGDGEERRNIENIVNNLKLQHVHFEGFQMPRPYYERASILVLTSEFEGFPLVLAECMSFGVVPVVYGSYSAVYDIIEDGIDGIIVPKTEEEFNAAIMAERIKSIMNDKNKLNAMALAAIEKSKNYSIDKIYAQWMELIGK